MVTIDENWIPSRAVHPFDMLKEELVAREIRQGDFAQQLGMKASNFSRMIKNKEELSTELALKLEDLLDIPARLWTGLQIQYHRDKMRIAERDAEEQKAFGLWTQWDSKINLKELVKGLGLCMQDRYSLLIKKIEDILGNRSQLECFISPMGGCFKRSTRLAVDARNLNTWLLLARAKASGSPQPQTEYSNEKIDDCAKQISQLAHKQKATFEAIRDTLSSYGITLCCVPHLQQTPVDGYSAWINGKPCIVVTLRYKDMDRFVFNVLHELGHIKLHLNELEQTRAYVSIEDYDSTNREEQEANRFAERSLISDSLWSDICRVSPKSISPHVIAEQIAQRAMSRGLSPSIAIWRYKQQSQTYNIKGYTSPKLVM